MIRSLFAKLRAEASFIVLLAVAAAGAWLYVQYRQMAADRDGAVRVAEKICAGAGVEWAATKGATRGTLCARRVTALARYERDVAQQSAQLLADEIKAASARTLRDNLAARDAAEAARAAALRMEAADEKADHRDIVDYEWTSAVNGAAGLRAPTR